MHKHKNIELYGLTGYPIAQSLSPLLHNWGFRRERLGAEYLLWPQAPEDLPYFMQAVRLLPISGLSVTIPHKQAVIPLLDMLTPVAEDIGAVNTIFWKDGLLCGDNTDVTGFCAPLQSGSFEQALVLGAGGSCRAVLAGLKRLKISQIFVAARSTHKAMQLEDDFSCKVIPWDKKNDILRQTGSGHTANYARLLVINTTPLGMYGKAEGESAVSNAEWALVPRPELVVAYDLVFNPLETAFLAGARKAGCTCIDGLSMLVTQGIEQFFIWTGHNLPFAEARKLLLDAL